MTETVCENLLKSAIPSQVRAAMVKIREEHNIFQVSSEHRRTGVAKGPPTALTEAVEGGNTDRVRWVLAQGADLKERVLDDKLSVTRRVTFKMVKFGALIHT